MGEVIKVNFRPPVFDALDAEIFAACDRYRMVTDGMINEGDMLVWYISGDRWAMNMLQLFLLEMKIVSRISRCRDLYYVLEILPQDATSWASRRKRGCGFEKSHAFTR